MSLSIKFPSVPPINNAVITRPSFFVVNSRMNPPIPNRLTITINRKGTGNDRDIPVFNAGKINDVSFRYL